ncbi:MAG: hypothetical protein CW691_01815 [Candidatus Bathyarchaeum sp.]|nr:MAG: hypothetical protein CW691_01815 [Candidatus Bathyarchaeum sp.]
MTDAATGKTYVKHVWIICLYFTAVYFLLGLLCFFVWNQSSIFEIFGWSWSNPSYESFQNVLYSVSAGGLGATSYGFWKLFKYYCSCNFDPKWIVWYVFSPVSGSLLGIGTYAVVVGGLLVFGDTVTVTSSWAIFALSFLVGFSAKRVLEKLHSIAGQLFEKSKIPTGNE